MKRVISCLLLCLLLPAAVFAAGAAHTHAFVLETETPATCTAQGAKVYRCSCGATKTETIAALGHDFMLSWTVDREPTCDTPGLKTRHCTRCDAVTDLLEIQPTNHDFTITTIEPTCTTAGSRHLVCKICGREMDDNIVPALGHAPGLWVVEREAECETDGLRSRSCSRCGVKLETVTIPKTGHTWKDTVVPPTCTAQGYTLSTCRACGVTKQDKFVKAAGHKPAADGVTVKAPTCTEKGEQRVACTVCGETLTVALPALGHDYAAAPTVDKAPTCTAKGEQSCHCLRCGARKDVTALERTPHTPQSADRAATCTKDGTSGRTVCAVCGKELESGTVIPAFGHDYVRLSVEKEPTCTAAGSENVRCSRCGEEKSRTISALGHTYAAAPTVDKAPTCTAKGEQSFHCLRCGARKDVTALDRTAHTPQSADRAATCTKDGTSGRTACAVCGKELDPGTATPALGHYYLQSSVETEPTCTAAGSAKMRCSRCGAEKNQSVPALGHLFDTAWTVDKPATCTAQGEQSHHCLRCEKRTDVTAIPKTEHRVVYDVVTAPICTEPGTSSGAHCGDCGKVLESAGVIPPTGHDFTVTEVYAEPDCTGAGRGQGVCNVCGVQEEITLPALGHEYQTDWTVDKEPTCTAQGEQSHHCTRCGKRRDVTTLARKAHTVVTDEAAEATCTRDGRTAGSHCAVCGKVLEAQEKIPAPGHKLKTTRTPATLKANGKIVKTCARCGKVVSKEKIVRVKTCALSQKRFAFDGKRKTPDVTVRDKKGNLLKAKRDYTLTFDKGRKKIGTYTVTIRFRRNYAGEKTLRFQIVPRKPTGLDVSQTATRITLSWEKVKGATHYAVYELVGKKRQKLCETQQLYAKLNDRPSGQKCTLVVVALTKTETGVLRSDDSSPKLTATKPAPLTLSAARNGQRAVLRWNNAGDCDYEIYYAPKKNGKLVCIGTTTGTSFTTGVYPHGRACFKVKAVVRSDTGVLSTQSSDIRQLWF